MENTSSFESFNHSLAAFGALDEKIKSLGSRTLSESVGVGENVLNEVLSPKKGEPATPEAKQDAVLKEVFSALFEKAEAVERRAELFVPESRENFIANLWWMIEQGAEDDLYALRRLRSNPPYHDDEIDEFMKIAEERILKRVNDPDYVVENGEEAYRSNQKRWEEEFAGQFIAIYGRRVVANAPTEDELWPKLKEAQKERGPFRAYIIKVGLTMPVFHGPRVQLAKSAVPKSSSDEENNA